MRERERDLERHGEKAKGGKSDCRTCQWGIQVRREGESEHRLHKIHDTRTHTPMETHRRGGKVN